MRPERSNPINDNETSCPACGATLLKTGIIYKLTKTFKEQGYITYKATGEKENVVIGKYIEGSNDDAETQHFESFCPICFGALKITKDDAFNRID